MPSLTRGNIFRSLDYPGIHVHVDSSCHFGGLWGCSGLQMASEVIFGVTFDVCYLYFILSCGSMVSKLLYMTNATGRNEAKNDLLACMASPQVKMNGYTETVWSQLLTLTLFQIPNGVTVKGRDCKGLMNVWFSRSRRRVRSSRRERRRRDLNQLQHRHLDTAHQRRTHPRWQCRWRSDGSVLILTLSTKTR